MRFYLRKVVIRRNISLFLWMIENEKKVNRDDMFLRKINRARKNVKVKQVFKQDDSKLLLSV